jgi:hypothetical protein
LKKRWRKWIGLAVVALVFLGPPLAFGVSNLLLMSPKGRSVLAARIQRVTRLETSIQGSTWSPWNGFTIYGLLIEQPAPLGKVISTPMLAVESIRIHPEWRALLDKQLVIRGIEVRKPDLKMPIELLSQIPVPPVDPALAAKQPRHSAGEQPPTGYSPSAPHTIPPTPPRPQVPQVDPALAAKSDTSPPKPPFIATDPTVWVTFRDARLSIVSTMKKEPLCRISKFHGALPIRGKSAGSELMVDGIRVLGNATPSAVRIPVKWQAPVLSLGVIDTVVLGIDCKLEAKIGLTPGLPFLIGGAIPKQEGKEIHLSETLRAKVGSMAGEGRFQGYALAPSSWQGQCMMQSLLVDAEFVGNKASFSHGQGVVIFQQGVLRCLDARLIGDDLSLLGNGMALSDGRFATHLRVVAAPDSLVAISRRIQNESSALQLTPLSTPQRAALDMRMFGFPGKIFYQTNPAANPVLIK